MINIQQYLNEMKEIQQNILEFLDNETNDENSYDDLFSIFDNFKVKEDKHKLTSLLHLISKISTNHHHSIYFFTKIDRILFGLKNQMKTHFSNSQIFNIFKSNKRILLFLIKEKIIIFDEYILKQITSPKYDQFYYQQYFDLEIQTFNKNPIEKVDEDFEVKRKIGENDNYICKLIQKDSVQEFIAYVNRSNISLKSKIQPSIFETNHFLNKPKKPNTQPNQNSRYRSAKKQNDVDDSELTLIKYAAFFGSIQIFKYLQMNGVILTPSLWFYAIHSNNAELIHLLEENHIMPQDITYQQCFTESIKCHHNEFAVYFTDNFLQNGKQNEILIQSLRYYNFSFIQYNIIDKSLYYCLCKYDHFILLKTILPKDVDTYEIIINVIL